MSAWFERRNDRPLIGFYLGSYYPLQRYPGSLRCLPDGPAFPEHVVVEDYLEDTERLYRLYEQAGGDMIFSAAPFLGMPWLEAALGCGVIADHTQGCTRAVPPARVEIPRFSADNPWVARMLEFIPALERHSGGRYPVGVTLMRGVSDLLSALYGAQEFIYRMVDDAAGTQRDIRAIADFWIDLGRALLGRLPRFHCGTGSFFYGIWSPGELIWLQEDAAALLSPALYDEFILPADCRLASAFEHSIIHLHPSRFIPTTRLVNTPLSAVELHIDYGGPRAAALEQHYRAVLERKPLFVWGDITPDDLEFLLTRLPRQGLAVQVVVQSVEEAHEIWDRAMGLIR